MKTKQESGSGELACAFETCTRRLEKSLPPSLNEYAKKKREEYLRLLAFRKCTFPDCLLGKDPKIKISPCNHEYHEECIKMKIKNHYYDYENLEMLCDFSECQRHSTKIQGVHKLAKRFNIPI